MRPVITLPLTVLAFLITPAAFAGTVRVPICLQYPDTTTTVPCTGVVPVDSTTGNPLSWQTLFANAGGNSGGAITAADGAIVGIGTLSSPAVGSTNYRLGQIVTALGSPLQAGGTVVSTGAVANGTAPTENPILVSGWDGTNKRTLRTDASGFMQPVGVYSNGAVGNPSPFVVGGTDGTNVRTLNTTTAGYLNVSGGNRAYPVYIDGSVLSGATDSGAPVKIGGYASNTTPTAVTVGQRINSWFNLNGASVIANGAGSQGDGATPLGVNVISKDGTEGAAAVVQRIVNASGTGDRIRSIGAADNTTGTGVQAVGAFGRFNTTAPTYGDGAVGLLQMDTYGNLKVNLRDNQNNPISYSGNTSDAGAPPSALPTVGYGRVYNGTTWDRVRDANATNATTGTGLTGSGILGKYNSTLPTYAAGQFGNVQLDANGRVQTTDTSEGGLTNATAPSRAILMGAQTTSGAMSAPLIDSSRRLVTVPLQETLQLVSNNTPSANQVAFGGDYIFAQTCSAYGTVTLRALGPDGTTYQTLITKTTTDTTGGTGLALGSNSTVNVTVSGTTACYATLSRVPS